MQTSQQLNKPKSLRRASVRQRVIAAIVFLGVVAFFAFFRLAAAGRLDIGRWLGPCGFKQKYALPCPTCGMTTSALAFIRGKIFEAFYLQPAAAVLCCILVVAGFLVFLVAVLGVYCGFFERFFAEVRAKHIVVAVLVIIAAGWVVTLARELAVEN